MPIHFFSHKALVAGALVEVILSGVLVGRIDINGGRESALLVDTADGPRVVRACDVRVTT